MGRIGRREWILLAGLGGIAAAWQRFGVRQPGLAFRDLEGAPGWPFAVAGDLSGGGDLLTLGLGDSPEPLPPDQLDTVVHRDATGAGVPVAVFSDFFCPFCRALMGRLRTRQGGPDLAITWHELPLISPHSAEVARSAVAAGLQGGYAAFYDQMIRDGFRPTARWHGAVADRAGLDGAQLLRDRQGEIVAATLAESVAAAARLGFIGTPGLVVRRRAVLGALSDAQMEDLIAAI